jgi:3',5'-cyclic AMP phosphodiesterase CpdA
MKLVHVTDTHLVPRGEMLHGLNPFERFDACIEDINRHHADAELCVITGDLAHNGTEQAYLDLRAATSRLKMPVHMLVGNHDRRDVLRRIFPDLPVDANGFIQGALDTSVGRFLLLDTVEHGKGWGSYCEKRLGWLRSRLDEAAGAPVFLFMHHSPFHVGIPSVDRLGLGGDGERIGELLARYRNIRHLFFGHYHRPICGSWRGIPVSTMRGTNHQVPFDLETVDWVPKSHEPPAYAVAFIGADQVIVHFHDYLDRSVVPYNKSSEGRPDFVKA